MRIVAGEFRSRVISAVEGNTTRPTTDKIKEAVFSRIGPYFDGGNMLDLFGGSGNMSLEAISRGMEHALVCDVSYAAVSTIRKNVKTLDVASRVTIWKMDYRQVLAKASQEQRTFDLVYLDPPYKKQQILHILQYLDTHDLVNELGDIVCESLKEDEFPDQVGALHKVKDVTYGITRITYYRKECME
ncbi:rRNA methyltransferase [[Clostridium] innocuum]|uniref:rRNA methyltransferase n=2 Tax=Clostridium innocuum TaxID=1522 RepID=A0A099I7C4_CLOIN|nr:rRNA methyltransferase [[Clostridium] innocuum]MBS5682856.1 16S rRNA (guanine(966)-N(2))-methyltransferase RsmD [[Clostridium] innocuum]MCR0337023.1 16S rRNA (guanine(966)-N(2))-methyltransferase RsmD [[Clostridium] innocuum]MCR0444346.1 16S rRNA (guanine(966)-N(2))-methyltransferase RsmD [[Clostridium] innocuum]MCR0460261.1 16S rRNA (guanine(966)-N(2))-methyltransferase RsmD [[Clostridium] innocuum]